MAKQIGGIIIKGRLAGLSYYKSKRSKYAIVRTIDPNASERAKTDPNYGVFRTYGKEFGMLGAFSGAVIRNLPARVVTMLRPYRVADFTKLLQGFLAADTAHDLGKRDLCNTDFRDSLAAKVVWLSKNSMQELLGPTFKFAVASNLPSQPSAVNVSFTHTDELNNRLQQMGIDGIDFTLVGSVNNVPQYSEGQGGYQPALGFVLDMATNTYVRSQGQDFGMTGSARFYRPRSQFFYIAFLIAEPWRLYGTQRVKLVNNACFSCQYVYQVPSQ